MNTYVAATVYPGLAEWLIVAALIVVVLVVPVFVVFWFARKTLENKRENVKLRLEVGKLADELEQVRKQRQPQ